MGAEDWAEAMRGLYARVDAALAERGLACAGCGECCHFDVVDHVLYASELERRMLRLTGEFPAVPDADGELIEKGLRCPFQAGNRCHARDGRVLGCRLHFCAWANSAEEMDFAEAWHGELKKLHDELGIEWEYRPLLPLR